MGIGTCVNRIYAAFQTAVRRSYDRSYRKQLHNDNFSIICSNCIGGFIYSYLGKQFLSPTINMYIRQYDFIKLVAKLPHYMAQPLRFIETDRPFPVAMLDDIELNFNHAASEQQARSDWNRRLGRINYENLYIIMYDRDNLTREQIEALRQIPCKRIAVLTEFAHYGDIDYVYHIKRCPRNRPNAQVFLDRDFCGIRTFEKQFDFVSWLNGQPVRHPHGARQRRRLCGH